MVVVEVHLPVIHPILYRTLLHMDMTNLNLARVFCSISSRGSAVLLYYGWKPSRLRHRIFLGIALAVSLTGFDLYDVSKALVLQCDVCALFVSLCCPVSFNPRLFLPPPLDYYFPLYYDAFNIAYKCLVDSFC